MHPNSAGESLTGLAGQPATLDGALLFGGGLAGNQQWLNPADPTDRRVIGQRKVGEPDTWHTIIEDLRTGTRSLTLEHGCTQLVAGGGAWALRLNAKNQPQIALASWGAFPTAWNPIAASDRGLITFVTNFWTEPFATGLLVVDGRTGQTVWRDDTIRLGRWLVHRHLAADRFLAFHDVDRGWRIRDLDADADVPYFRRVDGVDLMVPFVWHGDLWILEHSAYNDITIRLVGQQTAFVVHRYTDGVGEQCFNLTARTLNDGSLGVFWAIDEGEQPGALRTRVLAAPPAEGRGAAAEAHRAAAVRRRRLHDPARLRAVAALLDRHELRRGRCPGELHVVGLGESGRHAGDRGVAVGLADSPRSHPRVGEVEH